MSELANFKPLMLEYGELKETEKNAKKRMKELDAQLRPVLADEGEVMAGPYLFNCKLMAGRTSLDQKAMEADGIDLEPYRKYGAPFTQLSVKKIETMT